MSQEKSHRSVGAPIWGIILLFFGILLLLQTLDVLPWSLWDTLWKFWPAIIIIVGLGILLRRANPWLVSLIVVVILGGCLGIAIWQHGTGEVPRGVITRTYSQPVDNLQSAEVNINFNAGRLTLDKLSVNSPDLFEADSSVKNNVPSLQADLKTTGNEGTLFLDSINQQYWPNGGIFWDIGLTGKIPLVLYINSAASTLDLNLESVNMTSLNIDINAGSCDLELPVPNGVVETIITANAATVNISVPDNAAAKIQASSTVATLNVGSRFTKQGNDYVTSNYDTAANRIELNLNTNVGTVTVR